MDNNMDMPFRKAKCSYKKLGNKMKPYNKFMNMGLIEPATTQDMDEYNEQMGSSAPYMKMDPMYNGKPGVQQDDFEQFKKTTGDDVVGKESERTNVFDDTNKDPMSGEKDFYNKNSKLNQKGRYNRMARRLFN